MSSEPPSKPPIVLEARAALTRAGKGFVVFALLWMVAVVILVEAVFGPVVPGEPSHASARALLFIVALVPGAIVVAARWLGRHRPFRWLLRRPQPSVTVDDRGLEVCLPDRGCRSIPWEEIGRLGPAGLRWRQRLFAFDPPFDLTAPDGRLVMTIGYGLHHPRPRPWHARSRTLAEVVVERRPDRYGLLKPGPLTPHVLFALLADAPPQSEIRTAQRRRRIAARGLVAAMVLVAVVLMIWQLASAAP